MSKMEILQNNKENYEIQKDNDILQEALESNNKINNLAWLIYWT